MTRPVRAKLLPATQLGLAALVLIGLWLGLPARYLPVDLVGTSLALLHAAAAVSVLLGARWGHALSRVAAWSAVVVGAVAVSLLGWVVAHLAGLYGPVGAGGALLMGTIAALLLPYLIGLPLLQLRWLSARNDP